MFQISVIVEFLAGRVPDMLLKMIALYRPDCERFHLHFTWLATAAALFCNVGTSLTMQPSWSVRKVPGRGSNPGAARSVRRAWVPFRALRSPTRQCRSSWSGELLVPLLFRSCSAPIIVPVSRVPGPSLLFNPYISAFWLSSK